MFEIKDILKRYDIRPRKYTKCDKVVLVETDDDKFIVKPSYGDKGKIYDYLRSRSFNYFPSILNDSSDDYIISSYIESFDVPREQKILDLIDLTALLHNKTTHYKEVTEDDYKEIYEDLNNNVEYLYTYYLDVITIIESKVYMSPSEYTLARNISKVFSVLDFIKGELDAWFSMVKKNKRKRLVVLHNNLDLDHLINNKVNYLVSWDKSKIDVPIFDLYKLYMRHGLEFDFSEILRRYERSYPLHEDERKLFFILILFPREVEFSSSEYVNSKNVSFMIDNLYKAESFISPYYSNEGPEDDADK